MKIKKIIKVAIDSEASAGGGTQAKLISKHYNLLYLDTGKIYRLIAYYKIKYPKKFSTIFVNKKIKKLKISQLRSKNLLNEKVGLVASIIAKRKKIRKIVHNFQKKCAYHPPKKYNGSILDGRDINSKIIKDAEFKFYITAKVTERAKRRYKELKKLRKKVKFSEILKNLKKRDLEDRSRRYSKLKKTRDSILINTTNLSIRESFLKVKKIMDKKLKDIWH